MSGQRDITTEQAIAYAVDPRNDSGDPDSLHVMAQNYDPDCQNFADHDSVTGECKCWDGITSDDVETWTDRESGQVDVGAFGEWGPFILVWEGDADPGEPRGFTPQEALDAIQSRLTAYEGRVENSGLTVRMENAIDALASFISRVYEHGSTDLEWGEPGDCWDRLVNDDDILERFAEEHEGKMPDLNDDTTRDAVTEWAKTAGLARHFGDPHCIWCLQSQ